MEQPLSRQAYSAAVFLWRVAMTPQLDWLLWRGVFWCYLSHLIVILLARARRDRMLLSLVVQSRFRVVGSRCRVL